MGHIGLKADDARPIRQFQQLHHPPPTVHAAPADLAFGRQAFAEVLGLGLSAYRRLVETVADAPGGVLFHCAAGKDRTGVGSAILLDLARVVDEDIAADYAAVGLTLGRHPLALLRRHLLRMRLSTAAQLRALPHGKPARTAGLVIGRQRPGTASGVVFVTLEDETGCVNVIVWNRLVERQRKELLGSRLMGVEGVLEREGEVVHLVARRLVEKGTRFVQIFHGSNGGAGAWDAHGGLKAGHSALCAQVDLPIAASHVVLHWKGNPHANVSVALRAADGHWLAGDRRLPAAVGGAPATSFANVTLDELGPTFVKFGQLLSIGCIFHVNHAVRLHMAGGRRRLPSLDQLQEQPTGNLLVGEFTNGTVGLQELDNVVHGASRV